MEHKLIIPFAEWYLHLENIKLNNAQILDDLKKMEFYPMDYKNEDILKGYVTQSKNIFDVMKDGQHIKEILKSHIAESLNSVGITTKIQIKNVWSALVKTRGFCETHVHSNSWLNAVYYPHGGDVETQFFRPFPMPWDVTKEPVDGPFFNDDCNIKLKEGDMLVFPSYLKHRIYYNSSDSDRYSISMNILPSGPVGRDTSFINL